MRDGGRRKRHRTEAKVIELIEGLPAGVVGIEAKGEVRGEDYETVVIPAVEAALEGHDKVRLLYVLGSEFEGYSAAAMWDDTKVGMKHLTSWDRIALVTDNETYGRLVKGFGFLMPAEVKVFGLADLDEAKGWIAEGL
jgi:hypothetical protein